MNKIAYHHKQHGLILLHYDLENKIKGFNFSAKHHGVMFFHNKDEAIKQRNYFKEIGINVSKIRYGRRRIVDCTFGFQRRYQVSTSHTRYDKLGNQIKNCGSYLPDIDFENINFNFFEVVKND